MERSPISPGAGRVNADLVWAAAGLLVLWHYAFTLAGVSLNHQPFLPPQAPGTVHRSILEGAVFVGLVLWMLPPGWSTWAGGGAVAVLLGYTVLRLGWSLASQAPHYAFDDRAEALNLALSRLLSGEFPYGVTTSLGGPLSPLTASLLLALPGHLAAGRPEVMNLVMLPLATVCLLVLRQRSGSPVPPALLALALVLSPPVVWELVWGRDLMWGSVLILGATLLLDAGRLRAACAVFALGMCTRTGLLFLFPLWAGHLIRHHGERAAPPLLIAAGVALGLELPFALWDPETFFFTAPLGISFSKFSQPALENTTWLGDAVTRLLPASAARLSVIIAAVLGAALWLGWRSADLAQLSISMALVFGLLFLALGGYYRFEYLIWMQIPLVTALAAAPGKRVAPSAPGRV